MSEEKVPSPCPTCPWRVSNHGRPKPDFLQVEEGIDPFSKKNLLRLWKGIRTGEVMNCHAKDTSQGGSGDGQTFCYGALGLVIHEMVLCSKDKKAYRALRKGNAMTRDGLLVWAGNFLTGMIGKDGDGKLVIRSFPQTISCDEQLGVPGTPIFIERSSNE